jgi:hypothetical protein
MTGVPTIPVRFVYQPVKDGERKGGIFVEAHQDVYGCSRTSTRTRAASSPRHSSIIVRVGHASGVKLRSLPLPSALARKLAPPVLEKRFMCRLASSGL